MTTDTASDHIRQQLEAERETLRSQLSELGHGDSGRLDYDSNFADTSQVTAERGEAAALAASLQETLLEVERAIAKIANGTFGVCEDCGDKIGDARLEAMPTGRLCMTCASKR